MSVKSGSSIVQSGLVFHYDDANTTSSWKGKPTTNLIGNPFMSGGTPPTSLVYGSYEGTATIVVAPNNQCAAISPYWIKYEKNSPSNGRIWFLGTSGLTPATDYTYGCYVYTTDSRVTGFTLSTDNGAVSNTISNITTWSASDVGSIKRISSVFQSVAGSTSNGCRISSGDPTGTTFYMAGFQCELGSYPTPVVNGSRTSNQAMMDISKNFTIPTTNMGWNAINQPTWNGTTNDIAGTQSLYTGTANATSRSWEVVCAPSAANGEAFRGIYGHATSLGCSFFCNGGLCTINNNKYGFNWYDNAAYQWLDSEVTASSGQCVHLVGTWNGSDLKPRIYVNGELKATYGSASNLNYNNSVNVFQFGMMGASGSKFAGTIYVAKYYYDKCLSDAEVMQNFNAVRSRYGL